MYYLTKKIEISAAHRLKLSYDSKCENLHGHNWIITVYCKSKELDENGMVIDFTHIKKLITEKLDHTVINDVLGDVNPTAENIAYWVYQQIDCCYKVSVQESEGNIVIYEED